MIRRLTEEDNPKCQRLLSEKPAENLFIIGDIENFGFEQDFQKLWGDFDGDELRGILLKYRNNYITYASGPFDSRGFAEVINKDPDFTQLSGLESITQEILPYIERNPKKTRSLFYAKCDHKDMLNQSIDTSQVQLANVEDISKIVKLQSSISEFEQDSNREEGMRKGFESGSARTYFIEKDSLFVSSASTTAENTMSAMIVGVCTHPAYQHKGYASACMKQLCEDLLDEGKLLCLFYDNPKAGEIYKRLGFEDIGKWIMHIYEATEQPASI
ncbi:GNAT family N-acetyltransferase [Halobacillus sp. Marseille-Q1614]|uniref:GNAT family N-acetyltransferase n=1 Tax=Halobacillus sp. Marseille-Q1614 TaxID=2709134 RepID=UPI00156E9E9B|nr:GNAT family N-acetyltransferase [Halobacillus sp. Marseille-Q1614]